MPSAGPTTNPRRATNHAESTLTRAAFRSGTLARLWADRWAPLRADYAGPIPYPRAGAQGPDSRSSVGALVKRLDPRDVAGVQGTLLGLALLREPVHGRFGARVAGVGQPRRKASIHTGRCRASSPITGRPPPRPGLGRPQSEGQGGARASPAAPARIERPGFAGRAQSGESGAMATTRLDGPARAATANRWAGEIWCTARGFLTVIPRSRHDLSCEARRE